MYEYYRMQDVLPTYGGFQSRSDLEAHEQYRRRLFTEKLFLPSRLFQNARMIEFGPDSGENSLVFAQWGASCTLVEPNPKAHPAIKEYFQRYGFSHRLVSLEHADIEGFAKHCQLLEEYDIIDAEGFIYTVRPESLWIDLFARLLNDDGLVILSYCEAFGSFIELLSKVIHARMRRLTGMSALEAAQKLFTVKWDSIPHIRSFESWVMDVLENPFVRLSYFLEPDSLCSQMHEAGFSLYSSWPSYKDALAVYWHKKTLTPDEQIQSQSRFVAHSRISHIFGKQLFLSRPAPEEMLWNLVRLTDSLIDEFSDETVEQLLELLAVLSHMLKFEVVYSDPRDREDACRALESITTIMSTLRKGSIDGIVRFCNTDSAWIETWGMPNHFAVFRKSASLQPTR
jgi:hypothetical protein